LLRIEPAGDPPDQLAVSMATASLLRGLTEGDRPLLLAIDDVQWLDDTSGAIVSFALRRLVDRPIGMLVTSRSGRAALLALMARSRRIGRSASSSVPRRSLRCSGCWRLVSAAPHRGPC
jgi:hypothetical protein